MRSPTITLSVRNAIMLALGLTASAVAAGGCSSESRELCTDFQADYATCLLPADTDVPLPSPGDPRSHIEEVCFDGTQGCDPCDAERIVGAAIEEAGNHCQLIDVQRVVLGCGPDPAAVDCCYKVEVIGDISCSIDGRPLRVGAEQVARVAALRPGAAWLAEPQVFAGLRRPRDGAVLERLRSHWLASAGYEHASVAAFARVGLQLMSLAAPAALLRATQQAMADEVRHAQLCFGLAAAYGGAAQREAGPLRIDGCVSASTQIETVVREAIFEGALGEGAAALALLEGARGCVDPVVGGVLAGIAADEQRHALLAYQIVQWALDAEPQRAAEVVRACLREGQRCAQLSVAELDAVDDAACGYGVISSGRRARLQQEVWHEIVAPILTAMLQASSMRPRVCARAQA